VATIEGLTAAPAYEGHAIHGRSIRVHQTGLSQAINSVGAPGTDGLLGQLRRDLSIALGNLPVQSGYCV